MADPNNKAQIFELNNGNMCVLVTNYGCTITSLSVPDKDGKLGDVVLGFDSIEPYLNGVAPYFGSIVGRVANRIKHGKFTLNGVEYSLPINNPPNSLHGGKNGFDKKIWEVVEHEKGENPHITFKYHSRDGEEGYPGDVSVTATYTLTSSTTLKLDMEAMCGNKATPISLAQHTYWNLAGHNSGSILDHKIQIWANNYTPVDQTSIPTGEILPVKGTPFDFTSEKRIGDDIQQVGLGYDHNYVLDLGTEWPLTGGLPSQGFDAQTYQVERVYISGYQDGSVRLWDATYPSLQLIHSIQPQVKGMTNEIVSVTALDFCSSTLKLSVGDECGRVRLYDLIRIPFEKNLHFVTATGKEVHNFQQGDVPYCLAVFSILSSPICTLHFSNSGNLLFVGFNCGQVAMLDINTLSVLSLTDVSSETSSPVKVLDVRSLLDANSSVQSPKGSQSKIPSDSESGVLFTMTMNAHISVRDITTGNSVCSQPLQPIKNCTAISLHVIDGDLISEVGSGKHSSKSPESSKAIDELSEVGLKHSPRSGNFDRRLMNLLILLCCEDSLHLYSLNSMIEGDNDSIHKVDLVKPCCWTTTLKKDEKECGLVVLYQTGVIEIRSLPDLEVLGESSLMSILRWNYKTNMDKTMCSTDQGEIALVNGHELAFISVLSYENDLRIPDSLPCLYNKVLAASVDATLNFSPTQKQAVTPGILGGIMKGLKAEKVEHNADLSGLHKNIHAHLETLFSSPPFLKPSTALTDDQEIIQLNLDDIVIDEPLHVSSSSQKNKNETKDKETERDRLFHGGDSDIKPKLRTAEEIRAKYRKNEDASGAAAQARDKLVQRQEKLEKLGQHTEELKNGAEDFASMAKQLAKSMENRKWWQI